MPNLQLERCMPERLWEKGKNKFHIGQSLLDMHYHNGLITGRSIDFTKLDHPLGFKGMDLKTIDHQLYRVGDGGVSLIEAAIRSRNKDYSGYCNKMLVVTDIDRQQRAIVAMYTMSDDMLGIVTIGW